MLRFWGTGAQEGQSVRLDKQEAAHARVRRIRDGEQVGLVDGSGRLWTGIYHNGQVQIVQMQTYTKPTPKISLYIAFVAHNAFEQILDQATQMGVDRIIPVFSKNAFYRNSERTRILDKLPRWQKIIQQACKQSANPFLPKLTDPIEIDQIPAGTDACPLLLASLEDNTQKLRELTKPAAISLVVGPEGDFSPDEYQLLQQRGAIGITLGPYVLRTPTATLALITLAQALAGQA